MSRLSAFAAVCLADLVVLGIGNGVELSNLAGFSVLLVALRNTSTETWELSELAWALNVQSGELKAAHVVAGALASGFGGKAGHSGYFSEVLNVLLAEAILEALRGSSDNTSEESNKEDSHFDCLDVFV